MLLPTGSSSTEHQKHACSDVFWCSVASPTFRHIADALMCVFLTKRGMSVAFFCFLHHLTPSPSPPPFRHVDQTRWTRLFWRVCCVFFSSSSSPYPFPSSPFQTRCRCPKGCLQHIFFTTRNEHASFSVSIAFSCVLSRQT